MIQLLWLHHHVFSAKILHLDHELPAFLSHTHSLLDEELELQSLVIKTTQFESNSNEESVKQKAICQIKPREIQIAQHRFNFKTVYAEQHTSTHVT